MRTLKKKLGDADIFLKNLLQNNFFSDTWWTKNNEKKLLPYSSEIDVTAEMYDGETE